MFVSLEKNGNLINYIFNTIQQHCSVIRDVVSTIDRKGKASGFCVRCLANKSINRIITS